MRLWETLYTEREGFFSEGMKGIVYSGIVYCAAHPLADMHGLLRVCVRTRNRLQVGTLLARHEIALHPSMWLTGIWCESQSIAEQHATERHYSELLACSLPQQYLSPEVYQPFSPIHQKAKEAVHV